MNRRKIKTSRTFYGKSDISDLTTGSDAVAHWAHDMRAMACMRVASVKKL